MNHTASPPHEAHPIPTVELLERHSIKLEPSLWQLAKHIGRGNATEGIRFALQQLASQRINPTTGSTVV